MAFIGKDIAMEFDLQYMTLRTFGEATTYNEVGGTTSMFSSNFFSISSKEEIYDWLKQPVLSEIYASTYHLSNGSWTYTTPAMTNNVPDEPFRIKNDNNIVAGPVRLRQIRIQQETCPNALSTGVAALGNCYLTVDGNVDTSSTWLNSLGVSYKANHSNPKLHSALILNYETELKIHPRLTLETRNGRGKRRLTVSRLRDTLMEVKSPYFYP